MFNINNWEEYFDTTILRRGKQYFSQERVKGYDETEQLIKARVLGTQVYRVKIAIMEDICIPTCTCPYFHDNDSCKHLAAVLYYKESLNDADPAGKKAAASNASAAKKASVKKSTSKNQVNKQSSVSESKPKLVPVTSLFDQTRRMNHIYFNIRKQFGRIKVWNADIDEAKTLADQQKISLSPADVELFHSYDPKIGKAENTYQAYFKAEDAYREKVHKAKDKEHQQQMERMKKRYRWYYDYDKEPKYLRIRKDAGIPSDRDIVISGNSHRFTQIACGLCGGLEDENYTLESNLCNHVLAAMCQLDEYLYRVNPGDETDYYGAMLLKSVKKGHIQDPNEPVSGSKKPVIRIEPRISADDSVPMLSFKIGTEKMYILKDLQKLVEASIGEQTFTLGKNNALDFSKQTFAPEAELFYQMVENEVSSFETMMKRLDERYYLPDMKLKGEIRLEGGKLDDVFDLFIENHIPGAELKASGSGKKSIRFQFLEGNPKIPLTVLPELRENTFVGVRVQADFDNLLEGKRSYYIYDRQKYTITRIQATRTNSSLPEFLHLADGRRYDERRELNLVIGLKNLSRFFYRTLPELERDPCFQVQIQEEESIRSFLNPEPEFTFYLDAEDQTAECRAFINYGDMNADLRRLSYEDFPIPEWRAPGMEQEALECVEQYFPEYEPQENTYKTDGTDDSMFELLESGLDELMSIGTVHTTDAFQNLRIRRKPPVKIGVGIEGNLLDLKIQTEDVSPEELQELLAGYRRKKRYHRLKNGNFISMTDNEGLATLENMIRTMGMSAKDLVNGEMKLPLFRALYLDQMLEAHNEIAFDRQKSFRKLIRDFRSVKDSDFDVPEHLAGIMRSYQLTGYKWLRTLASAGFSGILADDMGLGKTLQMISVFAALKAEGILDGTASLIVCPASLVYNWQEEFHRFAPELSVCVLAGTAKVREKLLQDEWENTDVFITSYDLLKRDIASYEGKEFLYEVIDEAQHIKNPKAAVSKAVKVVNSRCRTALTGTPIENQLSDLWSIFDFLMPGFLYDYERFRSEMETPIVKYQDEEVSKRLNNMISPFILRRLKGDVLKDLPEKLEEIRFAKFEKAQQKLYDAQVLHMREVLENSDPGDRIKVLAEITKVRQICCDPELLFDNYRGESAKREAALDLITSAMDGGHKVLLFSQFTSMLELLEKDLNKEKIPYYKITGSTDKQERLRLVHSFNEDDTPLFLISLKAGGTGLNLTGADVVIHYDPWWNLAAQNQATDRAHRIGQKNRVTVYKLIVKGTIEEKIVELQEAKKDLADAVISGETTSLASLSNEELMQLFGD